MAKMASSKTLLLFVVILFLVACVLKVPEVQGKSHRNKYQGQNQTEMMELLKKLQARVDQLEVKERSCLRGRDGRDGIPGPTGRDGRDGMPGSPGAPGMTGRPGNVGQQGLLGPKGDPGPGGVQYVRWGRTTCPSGTLVVYQGRTGGGHVNNHGGGADYVCLPENPKYRSYQDGVQGGAKMYGAEYELLTNPFTRNLQDHEAPCAVCYVTTRSVKMMIPATYECPEGWTREYHGYLMSQPSGYHHTSNFICVDQHAEAVPGTNADRNGAQLHLVEGVCGSLPCHPYVEGRELTCAVCTK